MYEDFADRVPKRGGGAKSGVCSTTVLGYIRAFMAFRNSFR